MSDLWKLSFPSNAGIYPDIPEDFWRHENRSGSHSNDNREKALVTSAELAPRFS